MTGPTAADYDASDDPNEELIEWLDGIFADLLEELTADKHLRKVVLYSPDHLELDDVQVFVELLPNLLREAGLKGDFFIAYDERDGDFSLCCTQRQT